MPLLTGLFPGANEPPQAWDQATHLLLAARISDQWAVAGGAAATSPPAGYYPPLYHTLVAALFPVFGLSVRAATFANSLMLLALAAATFRTARVLLGQDVAPLAAGLALAAPILGSLVLEPLVDLTLAAVVAIALAQLTHPRFLETPGRIAAAALLWACGALIKWTFPIFLAGPLLVWLLAKRAAVRRRAWIRLLVMLSGASCLAAVWYVPNAARLLEGAATALAAGRDEGDPSGLGVESLLVYGQLLFGPYAALPTRVGLLLAAAAAVHAWWTGRGSRLPHAALLLSAVGVPYLVFTLLPNKDGRYLAATAPVLAIVAAWGWTRWPRPSRLRGLGLGACAAYVLAGQLLAWSDPRLLDEPRAASHASCGWCRELAADAQPQISAPTRGWPAQPILDRIAGGLTEVNPSASLAVLPDFPALNAASLSWEARRRGLQLVSTHPAQLDPQGDFADWEYVLVKATGEQGTPHQTAASAAMTSALLERPELFLSVAEFGTPQGPVQLLRTWNSVPPPDLMPREGRIELFDPKARWHLGAGWSFKEAWGHWALGRSATLRVQLPHRATHRLQLEVCPPEELVGRQLVEVRYASRLLGSFLLVNQPWAWRKWELLIPADAVSGGIDEIGLSFSHSLPETTPEGRTRPLAAAVRSVAFAIGAE